MAIFSRRPTGSHHARRWALRRIAGRQLGCKLINVLRVLERADSRFGKQPWVRRRYESTDHEWAVIEPLLPYKSRGVPRVDDRRVINGYCGGFERVALGRIS